MTVINYESAERAVLNHLAKWDGGSLVVTTVTEYDFGWVFCYDSKDFIETNELIYAIAGNAPLIVSKTDGQIYITGTSHGLDFYLAEYRNGIRNRAQHDGHHGIADAAFDTITGGGDPVTSALAPIK